MAGEVIYGHEQLRELACFNSRPVLRLSRFENIAGLECCGGIAVGEFVSDGVTKDLTNGSMLALGNIACTLAFESPAFAAPLFDRDN